MLNIITSHVTIEQNHVNTSFHVARDPEFLEGVQDGRQLLDQQTDFAGKQGWLQVDDVIQFIQQAELSPESQAKENHLRQCLDVPPHTPIYNLGLISGYLARLAEAAQPKPEALMFTIREPEFLAGVQIGADFYRREHGSAAYLKDRDLLAFYQTYLIPFADKGALINTGTLFGWLQAFRDAHPLVEYLNGEFATGYISGFQDWPTWNKTELLTDTGLAFALVTELSALVQATMHETEPYYTDDFQIGYAFGMVHSLLEDPTITIVQAVPTEEKHA